MAQMETLETKTDNSEISLSSTRRKKTNSITAGIISPNQRNREYHRELDTLRIALRDKENVIQTLKDQLCNTTNTRLAFRNGAPPLTEENRKVAEDRLEILRCDADNKKLAIKNLKIALERLDITDNIDVRIQQAELEYRLGREELELLTLREESRALQAAVELAESQEKQKNDTIFSCINGVMQITVHAVEVSADPNNPHFGARPREDATGLYVDWAVENSGLCKGDRILEVNGKLVVGASRGDLARLLAIAPDVAHLVVMRKSDVLGTLRHLRSENLRLTHRISYLEEQVRDLLEPRTKVSHSNIVVKPKSTKQETNIEVFQKGPQVTTLVTANQCINKKIPSVTQQNPKKFTEDRGRRSESREHEFSISQEGLSQCARTSRSKHKQPHLQQAKSTVSLNLIQSDHHSFQSQCFSTQPIGSPSRHRSKHQTMPYSNEFDSKSVCNQKMQSQTAEQSEITLATYSFHKYTSTNSIRGDKSRPAPPKKPLRLSLHRATSLQSVESAPPTTSFSSNTMSHQFELYVPLKKPIKRNHRGDLPSTINDKNGSEIPQPPQRTPSRAESCQSVLRWYSSKPRASYSQFPHISMEKWC